MPTESGASPSSACRHDAALPFREVRKSIAVGEDVFGTTGYFDAVHDGGDLAPCLFDAVCAPVGQLTLRLNSIVASVADARVIPTHQATATQA